DQVRQAFNAAYSDGATGTIAELLTEDAVWMPPGEAAIIGRDAVHKRYADQFASLKCAFTLQLGEIYPCGDTAFIAGAYWRIDAPVAGG
ncbi:nuclear transport factor 2 family protein, partial [candidate division KSB1 bacterium]|nr:nuclear transport factor 2 family protein [candidate division KSB1 bacterium]